MRNLLKDRFRRGLYYVAALVALLPAAGNAHAQTSAHQLPLFELGVLGLAGYTPDYPAAGQSHLHAIPLPYLVYRGSRFQFAGTSARGIVYRSRTFTFDVSASGSFSTNSNNNTARYGMPKLDYLGEVGPRLNILLARDAQFARLDFEIPARAVFSTNLKNLNYRGWTFTPNIAYSHSNFMNTGGQFKLSIGPEFATQQLMSYFYTVGPQYVTSTRAQYTATGGYLGSGAEVSYRYQLNRRVTIYTLAHGDVYKGATNAGSPLFKKSYGVSALLGVAFSFYQSGTLVSDSERD